MLALTLSGLAVMIIAVPTAFFVFRLQVAYLCIGNWVVAEVMRLAVAQ